MSESRESYTAVPSSEPEADAAPPSNRSSEGRSILQPTARRKTGLTLCTTIWVVLAASLLLLPIILLPNPPATLFYVVLALLPAVLAVYLVVKKLPDDALTSSFLAMQLIVGALPLVLFTVLVEWLGTFLIVFALFGSEFKQVAALGDDVSGASPDGTLSPEQIQSLTQQLFAVFVPWKLFLFLFLMAFIIAGLTEEAGKWAAARRYRKLVVDNAIIGDDVSIGSHTIIASACMVAIGFAATENLIFILASRQSVTGIALPVVFMALVRDLLAFPVHIGTQFYIAVAAARRVVLKENVSIVKAFLIAVLFHGLFDFVAFLVGMLVTFRFVAAWVGLLVPLFDLVLIGVLLFICRRQYKSMRAREIDIVEARSSSV